MDGQAQPIAAQQLYARLGTAQAPVLLDVRRQEAFIGDDAGATRGVAGKSRDNPSKKVIA